MAGTVAVSTRPPTSSTSAMRRCSRAESSSGSGMEAPAENFLKGGGGRWAHWVGAVGRGEAGGGSATRQSSPSSSSTEWTVEFPQVQFLEKGPVVCNDKSVVEDVAGNCGGSAVAVVREAGGSSRSWRRLLLCLLVDSAETKEVPQLQLFFVVVVQFLDKVFDVPAVVHVEMPKTVEYPQLQFPGDRGCAKCHRSWSLSWR